MSKNNMDYSNYLKNIKCIPQTGCGITDGCGYNCNSNEILGPLGPSGELIQITPSGPMAGFVEPTPPTIVTTVNTTAPVISNSIIQLTQQFIPNYPLSNGNISLSFVTANTEKGIYAGGNGCPPTQAYKYDILTCSGTSLTNGRGVLDIGRNCAQFVSGNYPMLNGQNDSYVVVIIGGSMTPDAPCYVDVWVEDNVLTSKPGVLSPLLYKFSWSASLEWIIEKYNENGDSYTGAVYPNGIPILTVANHTTQ